LCTISLDGGMGMCEFQWQITNNLSGKTMSEKMFVTLKQPEDARFLGQNVRHFCKRKSEFYHVLPQKPLQTENHNKMHTALINTGKLDKSTIAP